MRHLHKTLLKIACILSNPWKRGGSEKQQKSIVKLLLIVTLLSIVTRH